MRERSRKNHLVAEGLPGSLYIMNDNESHLEIHNPGEKNIFHKRLVLNKVMILILEVLSISNKHREAVRTQGCQVLDTNRHPRGAVGHEGAAGSPLEGRAGGWLVDLVGVMVLELEGRQV